MPRIRAKLVSSEEGIEPPWGVTVDLNTGMPPMEPLRAASRLLNSVPAPLDPEVWLVEAVPVAMMDPLLMDSMVMALMLSGEPTAALRALKNAKYLV